MEVFFHDLERWRRRQEALERQGVPVPLEHHWRWIRDVSRSEHWYVVANDAAGRILAAAPVQHRTTWSIPGHHRFRVTHFGHGVETEGVGALLEGLRRLVQSRTRLLSVHVEVFSPDPGHREAVARVARGQEYQRVSPERTYRRTARIDLRSGEEAVFAALTGSCRRAIREPEKKGHRVEIIDHDRWASRMDRLWEETFHRTGARPPTRDWARRIHFARENPELYRIVGTFGPDHPAPGSLVAFSCGMHNGDHVVYSDGASTRREESGVTLSYAPMWRLIQWAQASGCSWFDLGGMSEGTSEDDDPRGGISDFKRRFSRDVLVVGTEWAYEPPSFRGWLSDRVRRSASGLRALLGSAGA